MSPSSLAGRLSYLWWERFPWYGFHISPGMAITQVDGHHLTAVRWMAASGHMLIFLAALVIGAAHIGFETVFTESLVLMACAAAIGFFSTGWGLVFVLGFALGDFFVANTTWFPGNLTLAAFPGVFDQGFLGGLVRIRIPLLIEYSLLAALVVAAPTVSRSVLVDLFRGRRLSRGTAIAMTSILTLVTTYVFTTLWVNATPVLIRPIFSWSRHFAFVPPRTAFIPLQTSGVWVVRAAVVAGLVRSLSLWLVLRGRHAKALARLETRYARPIAVTPLTERIPRLAWAVIASAGTVLLLAGVIEAWVAALIMFGALLLARLVRQGLIPLPLEPWKRLVARVPVVVRLGIGLLLTAVLSSVLGIAAINESWMPMAIFFVIPILVLLILLPGPAKESRSA